VDSGEVMARNQDEFISTLFYKEYKKMVSVAYRMTGNMETAQDLVQDTFLLAVKHYDELLSHPTPEAWLMLTLRNLTWNENRKQKMRKSISLNDLLDIPTCDKMQKLDEVLPTKLLSTDEQKVLSWRFEKQLSYKEMANRLGISESGCRSQVSRVIAKCRKILKSDREKGSKQ